MRTRLDELRAIRLRLAEEFPRLQQQLSYARLRAEAIVEDAKATVQACRSAQGRRQRTRSKAREGPREHTEEMKVQALAADRAGS